MKFSCLLTSGAVILAPISNLAHGQQPTSTVPPGGTGAGLLNDWLRDEAPAFSAWDLGGQLRARLEHKEYFAAPGQAGAVDFSRAGDADNTYLLLREKVHLGYTPGPWFSAFVEARDSSSDNDDRNPNLESDRFDLHQAYVSVGNVREFPLMAKVGRQELSYGDERLIGAFDWNNLGRVFDAAKARWERPEMWMDAFVGRVVLPNDNHFNEPNDYDWVSGVYVSTKLVPEQITDLYFLSRNVGAGSSAEITTTTPTGGASPRDIYTLGLRVKSLPGELSGWDYDAELAGQLGRFKFSPAGRSLDHEAFAAHVAGGYTWSKTFGAPRIGLEYNYASGDSDPSDGKHETFDNLFPTNHRFYGYMDFVSWQNIHNLRLASSIKPHKKLTVTGDYHAFWLADTHDFFYQVNGAARTTGGYGLNPGAGSYVGSEVDLIATYAIKPFAAAQFGYGHFFVGDYVRHSLSATGSTDADFLYAQLTFSF